MTPFTRILSKIFKEEKLTDDDWFVVSSLVVTAAFWLYDNIKVEHEYAPVDAVAQPSLLKKTKRTAKR